MHTIEKTWTREQELLMKFKKIWLYIWIFGAATCTVALTHKLLTYNRNEQLKMESQLPYGNYLPDSENPLIRVVLKTNGFQGIAHTEVELKSEGGLCIEGEEKGVAHIKIEPDDARFQNGSIRISPQNEEKRIQVSSLIRGCGTPSYRGVMELYTTAEGIVIVNEVPLEEYLYGVVPSEMPASYHMEALKCQAVCARSYAYCQMLNFAYPGYQAHVDDSVSFQVYGNSGEKEATTKAVKETAGKKLMFQGQVVKTYYYSTSSGHSTDIGAWGSTITEDKKYLKGVPICDEKGNAYEEKLPWYRWKAIIQQNVLQGLLEDYTGRELGKLQEVSVTKRGTGDVALQLTVKGSQGSAVVETENKIRTALGGTGYNIEKQDGSIVKSTKLLPSAFFSIAKSGENYIIEGGGYGHGIGMSQNGANEMAKTGKTYRDILQFFYQGAKVK